jgi:hypothetical protein
VGKAEGACGFTSRFLGLEVTEMMPLASDLNLRVPLPRSAEE